LPAINRHNFQRINSQSNFVAAIERFSKFEEIGRRVHRFDTKARETVLWRYHDLSKFEAAKICSNDL